MFAFAVRILKDKYKSLLFYCLAVVAFLEMYVALFPTIKDQADSFAQLIDTFPKEIFQAINIDPASLSFSALESFLSTEMMSFLWPIMAVILAMSIAAYICASEIDKGTIETLASLPATRTRLFMERFLTGLMMLIIFTAVSIFGALPLAMMHGVDFVFDNYVTTFIGSSLFIGAVYSMAMFVSTLVSEKGRANIISGSVIVGMYFINIISSLNADIENLKYLSIFHYFSASDLLANNAYPDYLLIVLPIFTLVMFVLALWRFSTRDLS